MNIDTRYLIRWGIPGWILIITLGLYFLLLEEGEDLISLFTENATNLLAAAALVVVGGIPVGYILNQIHHVWVWVLKVNHYKYFKMEMELFQIFLKGEEGKRIEDRYRYLLARIHELGGILVALIIAFFIILFHFSIIYFLYGSINIVSLTFMVVIAVVGIFILISKNYYQKNMEAFISFFGIDYKTLKKK